MNKKSEKKPDIKTIMAAIDRGDKSFYASLSDDEKKNIEPYVLMRFASAAQDGSDLDMFAFNLVMTNDFVNVDFSSLSKHKELQWMLTSLLGIGSRQFRPWLGGVKRKKSNTSNVDALLKRKYPMAKDDDLSVLKSINSDEDIIELAKDFAYDDDQVKLIKQELKKAAKDD